jgi:nucleoside-diphosphate-sugar epimerase
VYHLAALIPQRRAAPDVMRAVNVDGTVHVLEAARAAGVRRVVYLSSVEVYGVPAFSPCTEDAPLVPIGEYGRNKVESENLCLQAVKEGLEVTILRPTTIVGPGLDEPFFLSLLRAVRDGKPVVILGSGSNRFQLVHGDDVAAACLTVSSHPNAVGQAFNVGSLDVPPIGQMVEEVLAGVGSRSRVVRVPPAVARAAVGALRWVGRAPLEPEHLRIALSEYVFSVGKAEQVLGWRPCRRQVDAMLETYAWLTGK